MKLLLYFKLQFKFFLLSIIIIVLPYLAFIKFSPYQVDGMEYFILAFLLIAKFSYFQNSVYRKSIEDAAKSGLMKTLNRTPSKNEIVIRVNDYVNARDLMLGLTALCVMIIAVFAKF